MMCYTLNNLFLDIWVVIVVSFALKFAQHLVTLSLEFHVHLNTSRYYTASGSPRTSPIIKNRAMNEAMTSLMLALRLVLSLTIT